MHQITHILTFQESHEPCLPGVLGAVVQLDLLPLDAGPDAVGPGQTDLGVRSELDAVHNLETKNTVKRIHLKRSYIFVPMK